MHAWDNPDGTVTVRYFVYPTEVDAMTGLAVDVTPGLNRAGPSGRFERTENGATASVADQSTASSPGPDGLPARPGGATPLVTLEVRGHSIGLDVAGQRSSQLSGE